MERNFIFHLKSYKELRLIKIIIEFTYLKIIGKLIRKYCI